VTEELCRSDCTGWTPLLFDWSLGLLAEMCRRYDSTLSDDFLVTVTVNNINVDEKQTGKNIIYRANKWAYIL
jgi:hypothetical protein